MNRLLSKKVTAGLAVSLLSMPAAMSLLSVSAPSHSVLASTVASVSPHYLSSRSYTVQPGDTLGGIAYRFHTTVAILVAINHIANPNTIYIGQILHISTAASSGLRSQSSSSSPSFETAHSTTYTVHPGDTLSAIASRFHVTVAQLVQWNHIANPNIISVGQVLVIGASTASSSSSDSSSSTSSTSSSARKYTVQSGDTLSLIAQKFGISWQTLASFNHLSNPNVLQVGEVLEIPGKQAASSTSAQLPAQSASVGFGQAIVNTAEHLLGIPYVWGGASPSTGFDCSGLVQYVFRQNGIPMPRTSWAQYAYVTKIAKSQLQPGDLVFFQTDGPGASHVGIYIGAAPQLGYSQAFIEAPQPGQSVQISNLNDPFYVDHYYGAGTVNP